MTADAKRTAWPTRTLGSLAAAGKHALTIGPFGSNLKVADYRDNGVPLVFVREIRADSFGGERTKFVERTKAAELAAHMVRAGDLLVTKMGDPPGDTALYPADRPPAIITADCIKLTPDTAVTSSDFLRYWLRTPHVRALLVEEARGVAQQKMSLERFRCIELPLPPLDQQRRIVAKIEALTQKSRRAKEALDAIPQLLERFRQSVLASAFRGDLTKDWRSKHPDVEPAEELLKRIRQERRKRWEEAELAKLKANGKTPKDDRWKQKYEEPAPVDAEGLPELPAGWCWASVGEISAVDGGLTRHAEKRAKAVTRVPLVSVAAVQFRKILVDEIGDIGLMPEDADKATLQRGDLLVVEGNGSLDQIGRVALWSNELPGARHQNHIIRVRPCEVSPEYVLEWLGSPRGRAAIVEQATSATGLYNLSLSKVSRIPVPLAPLAEQAALSACITTMTTPAERVADAVALARTCSAALDASILAKAFRGELTSGAPLE